MVPEWTGPFENWARKWVTRNFWRVKHIIPTKEDAVQECGLIFARCAKYYGSTVDNPAWFMGLFKQAVVNNWIVFSRRDSQQRGMMDQNDITLTGMVTFNDGPTLCKLRECSEELRDALVIIADAPSEFLELVFGARSKELTNRRIRRTCGISKPHDFVGELKKLLS